MKLRKNTLVVAGMAVLVAEVTGAAETVPAAVPAVAPVVAQAPAPATPAPQVVAPVVGFTAESLKQRYEFVGNLIERSSSAKQLEKSGPPEALKIREEARAARDKAKEALDKGELPQADAMLKEAAKLMTKAVRMAHPEEVTAGKLKNDFVSRRESVKTLIATGKRVAGEKGATKPEFAKAEELVKEAQALADGGKTAEGLAKLDTAYGLVKDSVRGMRAGEELRADKNFATKEDEYRYEQGRNDDYQNLVARVVAGQDASWEEPAKKGKVQREEADALAKGKNFDDALKKINESTNTLKAIIRRAGVPII